MTKLLILLLYMFPLAVIGQTKFDTTKIKLKHNFKTQPAYFLDSLNIDVSKTYFDFENIESIKVTKDTFYNSDGLKFGKVFIKSKNITHNWATLGEFKIQKTIADTAQPKVYIIDGYLISDTTNVRIEVTFIKSIDILDMAETKGVYYDGRAKTVFLITTKQKHKKRKTKNSH